MGELHFLNQAARTIHEDGLPVTQEATPDGVNQVAADQRLQACVDMEHGLEPIAVPPIAVLMIELLGTGKVLEDIASLPGRSVDDFEVGKALYEAQVRETL